MYLGDASDFTPLDLAGSLAVNMGATHFAAKEASFRIGVMKNKDGEVPAWADARLIAGIGAAVVSQFASAGRPDLRRVGHDLATGLLGSYVATETCRAQAEKMMQGPTGESDEPLAQLGLDDDLFGEDLGLDDDLLGVHDEEMAFAYGW